MTLSLTAFDRSTNSVLELIGAPKFVTFEEFKKSCCVHVDIDCAKFYEMFDKHVDSVYIKIEEFLNKNKIKECPIDLSADYENIRLKYLAATCSLRNEIVSIFCRYLEINSHELYSDSKDNYANTIQIENLWQQVEMIDDSEEFLYACYVFCKCMTKGGYQKEIRQKFIKTFTKLVQAGILC